MDDLGIQSDLSRDFTPNTIFIPNTDEYIIASNPSRPT
jgi:hypothetical protein